MKPDAIVQYNGQNVTIRQGYIDGTALCKANGKDAAEWRSNSGTKEFLQELATETGIPISALVVVRHGIGTSVHRLAWYHLGQWCNPKCAVWVAKLLDAHHADAFTHAVYNEPLPLFDVPVQPVYETILPNLEPQDLGPIKVNPEDAPEETRAWLAQGGFRIIEDRLEPSPSVPDKLLDRIQSIALNVVQLLADTDQIRANQRAQAQQIEEIRAYLVAITQPQAEDDSPEMIFAIRTTKPPRPQAPLDVCTCHPKTRPGLFPRHRRQRNPDACPVHQGRFLGEGFDAAP